jgi:hypothetical protein
VDIDVQIDVSLSTVHMKDSTKDFLEIRLQLPGYSCLLFVVNQISNRKFLVFKDVV